MSRIATRNGAYSSTILQG